MNKALGLVSTLYDSTVKKKLGKIFPSLGKISLSGIFYTKLFFTPTPFVLNIAFKTMSSRAVL